MSALVDVQRIIDAGPSQSEIEHWVAAVLQAEHNQAAEVTVRIVDEPESAELNQQYRHKQGPTNVLSFPFENPTEVTEDLPVNLLGDLVICAPVVSREALEQHKTEQAHWAHMVVHGTLHLLGYDHMDDNQAEQMENREIRIMDSLGYANPYRLNEEQ